jgi:uncharacterized protein
VSYRRPSAVLACALAAFTLGALGRPLAAQAADAGTGGAYVEAVGSGEVRIAPDRATLLLSVETKGASAALVAGANARIQHAVLDTLAALGLRGTDVSTQSFNVAPDYEPTPQGRRPAGYVARNAVIVRFADLTRIGAAIDATRPAAARRGPRCGRRGPTPRRSPRRWAARSGRSSRCRTRRPPAGRSRSAAWPAARTTPYRP